MNVDTQFLPPAASAALQHRSVHTPPDQASSRPVERPHHNEASDNETRRDSSPVEQQKDRQHPSGHKPRQQESELSAEDKRELDQLKARDREVRTHEAAHKAAAGHLARGGAQFETQLGPDGKRYAVGGEVSIDTSEVNGDPQATIRKAQTIRNAANAPAEPSAQDRRVSAKATQMEASARAELAEQKAREQDGPNTALNTADHPPAPVGELLDVIV